MTWNFAEKCTILVWVRLFCGIRIWSVEGYSLRNKGLTTVPDDILWNVTALDLSNNLIETCPDFPYLSLLRKLSMTNNRLVEFPNLTAVGSTLHFLDLSDNRIRSVPEPYTDLPVLQNLVLNTNDLQEFPNVTKMTSLQSISLLNNNISSIPGELLAPLVELNSILLQDNPVTTLPDVVLPKLTCLFLDSKGEMAELPSLPNLGVSLQLFNLGDTLVTAEALRALTALKVLRVSNLSQTEMVSIAESCHGLEWLFVYEGMVRELPPGMFSGMERLRALIMPRGRLERLPDVSDVRRRMVFRLSGNPIVCDSRLEAFHEAVAQLRVKHDDAKCAAPPEVAGKRLSSVRRAAHVVDVRSASYAIETVTCLHPYVATVLRASSAEDCALHCLENTACYIFGYNRRSSSCGLVEMGKPGRQQLSQFGTGFIWQ